MARPPMFQRATVTRIVKECADARTYVLAPHDEPFSYQAGQFCTFKVTVDGRALFRSYSMSSAPETDGELMTTVKRVRGGRVSNWLHDNVIEGDEVEVTRPAGTFLLRPGVTPVLGFSGGSGITPILSLAKSALATTDRPVRLLCADRDEDSVIFGALLDELVERYPGRLSVTRHLDSNGGFLDADAVRAFVGDDVHGDSYLCGPEPFMALVEEALPGPGRVFSERFGGGTVAAKQPEPKPAPTPSAAGEVTVVLDRKTVKVALQEGETILESARRGGLAPPFSCEAGNCGTCIATLTEGTATMRNNEVLSDDEIADGLVLTCQGVPDCSVVVEYE
ncbi:ferredoxin--NADP reductase [Rhodococcus sp. Q]|uniref:ferredoxin--NADP reductase n=1 Tax=Rhodococcus sp. Q TaxID=2502252 RepID=UPI0010F8BED1|nr:ferredoxin--NADP reductase [Rhodococcus sp. Q]